MWHSRPGKTTQWHLETSSYAKPTASDHRTRVKTRFRNLISDQATQHLNHFLRNTSCRTKFSCQGFTRSRNKNSSWTCLDQINDEYMTGWWFQPSWKILVTGKDYPRYYGKIKNVPNHQPDDLRFLQKATKRWTCCQFWWMLWSMSSKFHRPVFNIGGRRPYLIVTLKIILNQKILPLKASCTCKSKKPAANIANTWLCLTI